MDFSVADIRRIERHALARGLPLMARAGLAAARFAAGRVPAPGPVLALAGPGNNGGDALVAATWLRQWGYDVRMVMRSDPARLPADARQAHAAWRAAGGSEQAGLPAGPPALVLDGLFGIGLNRPLEAGWQELADAVNEGEAPVLALDVPSGLDAATGRPLGRPVLATWTLSFIAAAPGLRQADGPRTAGECHVEGLDLPRTLVMEALAGAV